MVVWSSAGKASDHHKKSNSGAVWIEVITLCVIKVVLVLVDTRTRMVNCCGGKMRTRVFYEVPVLPGQGLAHELTSTVAIAEYNHTRPSRGRDAR